MKTHLSTGCLVLGILCFLYFIGIVLYAGIRTSICWVWALAGALFLFLWRALIYENTHPDTWLRFVTGVLGVLIAVGVIITLIIGGRIVGAMKAKPRAGLEYVVVLGAQVKGTKPSRALRKRLDEAVSYAGENPGTSFVLSGGKGPDEGISEAECMYRYMTEQGISPERLLMEDQSTSTQENLVFSDRLYDLKEHSVGILSNNFHVYRAMELAKHQGYTDVTGIPAPSDAGMQPHNIMREICCVLLEKMRGTVD